MPDSSNSDDYMNLHMDIEEPMIKEHDPEELTDIQITSNYPDYRYRNRVNYMYTKINEDRMKKYQCSLCNFETRYRRHLQDHFMRHLNIRPYSCTKCSYSARTSDALKLHTRFGCGKNKFTSPGRYKCDLCDYSTPRKDFLRGHQRCHSGERPFACDKCDYRSVQKLTLKTHKLIHITRDKTFKCGICDCKYLYKCDLVRHVKQRH